MLTLHVLAGACSLVPHTALEWAKADYHLELVNKELLQQPDYLAMNPEGTVPLLVENNFTLTQNVAIVQYTHNRYPNAQLFGTGDTQAQANVWRWLIYFNADIHKNFSLIFHTDDFLNDPNAQQALKNSALAKIDKQLKITNDALQGQEFLTGEMTIADVYLYVILRWTKTLEIDLSQLNHLQPFFTRIQNTPLIQRVLQQEKIEALA